MATKMETKKFDADDFVEQFQYPRLEQHACVNVHAPSKASLVSLR